MKKIPSPHDTFFHATMSDIHVAKEFLQTYVPKTLQPHIDFDSLILQNTKFVNSQLEKTYSDILYSVKIKNQPGYVYLLIEHQRKPEKLMPFRLWNYLFDIMDYHIKKHHSAVLPLIIPLVFFNGKSSYPYTTDFFQLFGEVEPLAREYLLHPFTLVDLTQIPDETLKQLKWSGFMQFAMKHLFDKDYLPIIQQLVPLFKWIYDQKADHLIIMTLNYCLQANLENAEQVAKIMGDEISQSLGGQFMSLARKLREEGEQIGIEKGIEKGIEQGIAKGMQKGIKQGEQNKQREIAQRMLKKGADVNFIVGVTGLSLEEIEGLLPV